MNHSIRQPSTPSTRVDKDAKEARNRRAFEAWTACKTQEEIAVAENMSQPQSGEIIKNIGFGNIVDSDKAAASHAMDFDVPLYNVWPNFGSVPLICGRRHVRLHRPG